MYFQDPHDECWYHTTCTSSTTGLNGGYFIRFQQFTVILSLFDDQVRTLN